MVRLRLATLLLAFASTTARAEGLDPSPFLSELPASAAIPSGAPARPLEPAPSPQAAGEPAPSPSPALPNGHAGVSTAAVMPPAPLPDAPPLGDPPARRPRGAGPLGPLAPRGPIVRAHAIRRLDAVAIDGRLDDAAWAKAPRQGGFLQRFPSDAAPPSSDTQFAILYDDEAIYVGVWASDAQPHLIRSLLTRRDTDAPADSVLIAFDSYHDRRTAYGFQLNAAGVQRDMIMFDDVNQDDTWDAVWTGDVAITATGWTAEFRIPLSQLRFARNETQEWGLQLLRTVGRTGEQDAWSPWPRSAPQIVSKFGVVDGIDHLRASRRLELLPYASAGFDRMPVDAGDPLNDRYNLRKNIGLDLKYGLGPAFTLSATINPDFGQVEADPSKVNLGSSELFFAEKRPFFLEGADLFKLQIGNSDNSSEGAFYSRRIGAAPAEPDGDYDYLAQPTSTAIYGAAKLTGKTASGWSVGVLDAITGQEKATTAVDGMPQRAEPVVAALTNYAIARVKRDLRDGNTSIGLSATAVNRKLDDATLRDLIREQAYTGGAQLQHRWGDRWGENAWTANINLLGSSVHGTAAAIAETQQSSVHYFQRPDAGALSFDPARTSMQGFGLKWLVGRLGDTEHWRFGFGGDMRSPGLELNDAGFQTNSNRIIPFFLVGYKDNTPGDHVLNWNTSNDVYAVQTFDPLLAEYGLEYNAHVQFKNYWQVDAGGNFARSKWWINGLRGGHALRLDPGNFNYLDITTDTRAPVWFSINFNGSRNWTSKQMDGSIDLGATIQARSNVDVYIGPSIYKRRDPLQYVDQVDDMAAKTHYVFGRIHQTDVAMTMRVNWTFSPHLALQVYAQPFLASGHYDQLKDVDAPSAERYGDRFHTFAGSEMRLDDDVYRVTRNGASYSFDRPDYNFRQLRSTVVLRWEYLPGSTVFAIWSRGQTSDSFDGGRFHVGADLSTLGRADSENVVMVKANYWIGL